MEDIKPKNRADVIPLLRELYKYLINSDAFTAEGKHQMLGVLDCIIGYINRGDMKGLALYNNYIGANYTDAFDLLYEEVFGALNIDNIEQFWALIEIE